MGYARYYFARDPKGGIKRITARAYDAFHADDGTLPLSLADDDGMINLAELVVETEDRAPVRLISAGFSRYAILDDGRADPDHRDLHLRAAMHRLDERHRTLRPTDTTDVIDASGRFEGKRLDAACRWSPTEADLNALREAVGRRLVFGEIKRERRENDLAQRPVSERMELASAVGPDWQLRLLASDPESTVRAAVAGNEHAPKDALDALSGDADPGVLTALAGNYRAPSDWLSDSTRHESAAVRAEIARNFRTPDHLVAPMAWADPDPEVRRRASERLEQKLGAAVKEAASAHATASYLGYAVRDSRVDVRLAAATNPRLPEKLIPLLARDHDPLVKQAIAARLGIEGDPARLFADDAPEGRPSDSPVKWPR